MSRLTLIYRRTAAGQRAAIEQPDLLSADERRLLLRVNGLTPLEGLLAHGGPLPHAQDVVHRLLGRGLIEPVPQD